MIQHVEASVISRGSRWARGLGRTFDPTRQKKNQDMFSRETRMIFTLCNPGMCIIAVKPLWFVTVDRSFAVRITVILPLQEGETRLWFFNQRGKLKT